MNIRKLVGSCGLMLLVAGCGSNNPLTRLDNLEQRVANLETKFALMQQWFIIFVIASVLAMTYLYFFRKK